MAWSAIGGVIFCNLALLTGYAVIAYAFDNPIHNQGPMQVCVLSWILGTYTGLEVVHRENGVVLDTRPLMFKIPVASIRCCIPVLLVRVLRLCVPFIVSKLW